MKNSGWSWGLVRRGIYRVAIVSGVGVMATGLAWGQTANPRYQSPFATTPTASRTLPTPAAITPNGTVVEDVVARVNDQIISRSDLERSQQQFQQEVQQQNLTPAQRDERERDLLRDMIDQQLLLSKGKELGLNADAEVIRRLDEIRKQNHLESMDDLEKAARSQGVNFEDFKANIRNGVITQQVVRDEVGRRLQMTQGQEQAYFEAHKQEFQLPEQVRLSEILVPTPENADAATVEQAQKKAEDLEAKLKGGAKFEDMAKQSSGGPTAAQGGDLGQFKRGALAKVLEDQTFGLKAGEFTAPIRTRQGFVILKVTEHQDAGVPTLKQVEPQVQEAMYMQQMQPALRAYLTKLREEAYIDIKPGFVDSGASSKQTKPVFTAYAAPTPKKKRAEKARFERGARGSQPTVAKAAPAPAASSAPAATEATNAKTAGGVPTLPPEGASTAAPSTAAASGRAAGTTDSGATAAGESGSAVAATPADTAAASSGKTRESARVVARLPKQKKIRREKVRFGQAPRTSLPAGPEETASGADVGAGAASAAVTPGGTMEQGASANAAPGTAIAPTESTTQISSTSDADPLAPKTVSTGKTRFASRDKEFRAEKAANKQAKVREKIAATPAGPSVDETATQKTQAAPLGLNGDTAKKEKKKREKGAAKERLQGKKPEAPVETPVAPTVNPSLGTSPAGTTPTPPAADTTTLPPATAPTPGAPPQGQPLPPSGTPQTTPNGSPAPQQPQ